MNKMDEETIFQFLNGKLSYEESMKFKEWIEQSEADFKFYMECRNIWLGTAMHIPASQSVPSSSNRQFLPRQGIDKATSRFLKYAAVLLAVFAVGALASWLVFSRLTADEGSITEIFSLKGSRSFVRLPDGSSVWLNSNTKLTYDTDFNNGNERIINLEGEAYFEVMASISKPFIVRTSHLIIEALGTAFNIKAYPEDATVETTLISGELIVRSSIEEDKPFTLRLEPKHNITYFKLETKYNITTGQDENQVSEKTPGGTGKEIPDMGFSIKKNIRPEIYTSWKEDNWVIEGEPLINLAVMLERRFNTKIEIESGELADYKFSGTIRNETLEQVLKIIRMTAPVKYEIGIGVIKWKLDSELEREYKNLIQKLSLTN
jgi:transmembrane sensor